MFVLIPGLCAASDTSMYPPNGQFIAFYEHNGEVLDSDVSACDSAWQFDSSGTYTLGNDTADDTWYQFMNDVGHTGYSTSDAPDTGDIAWQSDMMDGLVSANPVVYDGKAYVIGDFKVDGDGNPRVPDAKLFCIDISTGDPLWNCIIPAPEWGSWSSPAVNGGNVFVSSGKETNCINAETGEIVWTFTNPSGTASCNGGPAIAEGKVVCSDWDGNTYYCLNESTGNLLWTFPVGGYSQGTPAYDSGRFYLTSWQNSYLYCVDAQTGEQAWKISSPGDAMFCGSASVSGDFVFVATYNFGGVGCLLYALSKEDGSVIWQQNTYPTDGTPTIAYGNVYLATGCKGYSDHITYCFNATTGEKIWETDPEDDIGGWTCSVAAADGKVFAGTESSGYFCYNRLIALDAETGEILWYNNLGGATPTVSDGMIFTIGEDRRLYAYGAPASAPTADFTADAASGAAPFTVAFEDTSTGFPTSWEWDLDGDGTVDSTKQDPEYTYEIPGTYTVTLTVANGLGSDAITRQDFIEVLRPEPTADFTADAISGKAPFTVMFTDLSTRSPTEWAWDFNNDGTVDSTEQNPVYTYETEGLYAVTLTATNDIGSDTITKENYIYVFSVGSGIEWQSYPGGTGMQDYLYSSCQADDGGYVSVGFTDSNDGGVEGNHGSTDVWVVKYDAGGNISWQKCLGGSGADYGFSVCQAPDGGYIVGSRTPSEDGNVTDNHGGIDIWLFKLDESGTLLWQKCYGGTSDEMMGELIATADGGYAFTGWALSSDGDLNGHHGPDYTSDVWVVKLDADGTISWQKNLGGSGTDQAKCIIQTSDGGYAVAGHTQSSDGDVVGQHGDWDVWVVKLDADGNLTWQKCLGGTSGEFGYGVTEASDGGVIVAGKTHSIDGDVSGYHGEVAGSFQNWDMWVVKLDADGAFSWQNCLGGSGYDIAQDIIAVSDGMYVVAGCTGSSDGDVVGNHGDRDGWFVTLNESGTLLRQRCIGGGSREEVYGISPSSDGGYTFVGWNYLFHSAWVVKLGSGYFAPEELSAAFEANVTSGNTPLEVTFTDLSTGDPDTWAWDFNNDGTVDSTEQNPVHTYTKLGTYTVNLTVTNADGSDTETKAGFITVVPELLVFPGCDKQSRDLNSDGVYEDVNGNGRLDFADVVTFFANIEWATANEPAEAFDLNGNGMIDFDDLVMLFNEL